MSLGATRDQCGVTEEPHVLTDIPRQLIVEQDLMSKPVELTTTGSFSCTVQVIKHLNSRDVAQAVC